MGEEAQRAACGDGCILLAQRSGGALRGLGELPRLARIGRPLGFGEQAALSAAKSLFAI